MRSAAERNGCFQLVNYGISKQLHKSATSAATELLQIPPDQKRLLTRPDKRKIGFEDDKFRWCKKLGEKEGETTVRNLEGNLQNLYNNFRASSMAPTSLVLSVKNNVTTSSTKLGLASSCSSSS